MRAKDVMTSPAVTVRPEAHCKMAAALLSRLDISALPVVDSGGRLVGIVGEADLLQLQTAPGPRAWELPAPPRPTPVPTHVEEVMTRNVFTVEEDADVGIVAQRMLEAGVKRLPVMRAGRVVGVVSRYDLIRLLARRDGDRETAVHHALADEALPRTKLSGGRR
jgi:CBS domain-containing protein